MSQNTYYKDIYKLVKMRVEMFAEAIGQSQVIADCIAEGEKQYLL